MKLTILVIVITWFLSMSRNKKRIYLCVASLGIFALLTIYATTSNVGIDEFELNEGVSIRQDSTSKSDVKSFFYYHNSRSHQGGGLAGGK